jgi:prepilin-type N-terminal cleavage/methylation domain-containing protein
MKRKGFTLIELMLVVAIIGLLAAIALPKFANLVIKAKEASVKGKLGALRSAIAIYYSDNEGAYPLGSPGASLTTGGKYLDAIPSISIPTAPFHRDEFMMVMGGSPCDSCFDGNHFTTSYSWILNNGNGLLFVSCTHTDSGGTTWSLW